MPPPMKYGSEAERRKAKCERLRLSRQKETPEHRQKRLATVAEQMRRLRQNESDEQRKTRLALDAKQKRLARLNAAIERREERNAKERQRIADQGAVSTGASSPTALGPMVAIKEERPDEAEIQEMAAKMKEANKIKMAAGPQQNGLLRPISGTGGQTSLTGYVKRLGQSDQKQPTLPTIPDDRRAIDDDSQRGRFGWITLANVHIPVIKRYGEHYCAVRMVEQKLISKFLNYMHTDICKCTNIRSYYITDAEARVFNDVNLRHCDGYFGRDHFTANVDSVVPLSEATEFYNFLELCYSKLNNGKSKPDDRCGFIRINNESVVPYTVRNGVKFVPLFYFEGETESLKLRAETLEGWDLSYLKFCCKVQGIRNELFESDTCSVISLSDIKSYFPAGTVFDEYWPAKTMESQLISNRPTNVSSSWTRQPVGATTTLHASKPEPTVQPPRSYPTPPATVNPAAAALASSWAASSMMHQQHSVQTTIARMTQQAQAQTLHNTLANGNSATTYNTIRPWPVHSATNPFTYYPQVSQLGMQHVGMQQQQQKAFPPPLVRSNHASNSGLPSGIDVPRYAQNLQQPHQSSSQMMANVQRYRFPGADVMDLSSSFPKQDQQHYSMMNGGRIHQTGARKRGRIIQIEDEPPTNSTTPGHKFQTIYIGKQMIEAINARLDADYNEFLMTSPELLQHFFPSSSQSELHQALQDVFGADLFIPNKLQLKCMIETRRCRSAQDAPLLVHLRDVMRYMNQLTYVLSNGTKRIPTDSQQSMLKRQRTS